jgi:tripartite-type tricarboxylate transporter receptor subunit TctC
MLAGAAGLIASPLLPYGAAAGQDNPFAGQTIEFLSGFDEASSANPLLRQLALSMESILDARIVYRSNPGGSTESTAALLASAPPDGLTIGTADIDSLINKALGETEIDIMDFRILGCLDLDLDTLFANAESGITSITDLVTRDPPANLPVRATSSGGYLYGMLINAALGTRIRPVTGYSSAERNMAFLNNEGQIAFVNLDEAERYIADGTGVPLLKTADVDLPPSVGNPPALSQFPANPRFAWVVDYLNSAIYSRIVAAPKGIPQDRLDILRAAFMQACADADMIAVAQPLIILDPRGGGEIEAALTGMLARLESFSESLKEALACGQQLAETGQACAA